MSQQSDDNSFLEQVADIKPLKQDKIAVTAAKPKTNENHYRRAMAASFGHKNRNFLTDGEVEPVLPDEVLSYKKDGVQPAVFKKLYQGKYPADFHLDLHRKTVAEARESVYQLLLKSKEVGFRSLLITHGKGAQSNPPARLKSYLNRWLRSVDWVLGFHSATPRHGGTGSVYVLLKKSAQKESVNPSKYD